METLSFKISPTRGPFQYHAWLELPFPLSVKVNKRFFGNYNSVNTEICISILSNVYKVVTGSFWQKGREVEEWAERVQAGKEEPPPLTGWLQDYVTRDKVYEFVKNLENLGEARYVHVEEIPAVVHVVADIPTSLVPSRDFDMFDLLPQIGFINQEIFSELQLIIDAYRIAAYPWMRYAILPVSEALVDHAFIYCTDNANVKIGNLYYGFDVRSPHAIGAISNIQTRFDRFLIQMPTLHAENQMASAYYLYRMRRWAEAITLASAIVDRLLKEFVFKIASSEIEAQAIWIAYGRNYQNLFNEVFPKFGKPKVAVANKALWDDFVNAKKERGAKAHGTLSSPFSEEESKETRRHLAAFHEIAKWLTQQMDGEWTLDCFDENNKRLQSFP